MNRFLDSKFFPWFMLFVLGVAVVVSGMWRLPFLIWYLFPGPLFWIELIVGAMAMVMILIFANIFVKAIVRQRSINKKE